MSDTRTIYTVAELNRKARIALEQGIGEIWVEGEISRLTRHASGHWYFTLKDESAAVSCAMFKQNNASVPFEPKDGIKVRVKGQASLYEPRGNYQLIIHAMEEAGKGTLQEQFEKLKEKLSAEGLFDNDRKKPLPMLPRKIGVVTSPTGAAIQDIIHVLTRRFPNIEILLAPVTVQGDGSAERIAKAINYLNTHTDVDLIISGRGGGSLEDLWAFNEESVARAIAASDIPIISAVGHEIDFTISDFVADVRAPTPSAAAELAVPVQDDLREQIRGYSERLATLLQNRSNILKERIPGLHRQMSYILQSAVREKQQHIDESALRMSHELRNAITTQKQRLPILEQQLMHQLKNGLSDKKQTLPILEQRLAHPLQNTLTERKQALKRLTDQLRILSPLGVLERGYSLTETADGQVVQNSKDLAPGDLLRTRFAKGTVLSEIKEKHDE